MKRTELKALVAYGIYNVLGVPPEQIEEGTASLFELVQSYLGGDSLVLGGVVAVYIWARTKRKNTKDNIKANMALKGSKNVTKS